MSAAKKAFMENLGKRIASLRIERGLTQKDLGIMFPEKGHDKQSISRLEQGANPTAYTLVQLAVALNVSLNDLVDFSTMETKPGER